MRGVTVNDSRAVTKRILVVANETDGSELEQVIRSCARGADAEVLLLAPESRQVETCLGRLHAAGVDARGRIGDDDPLRAVVDGLDDFAADEVVLATRTSRRPRRNLIERVRQRFAGPIFHLVLDPAPAPRLVPRASPLPLVPRLSERR
jgi:hypothetical protein